MAQARNPFGDPRTVCSAEGLREFCMGGTALLDLSALIVQGQFMLKTSLKNANHPWGTCLLVARPLGLAAEDLVSAERHLRMCWAMACRRLPELGGGGGVVRGGAGGAPAFKAEGGR